MSKYDTLWAYFRNKREPEIKLSFAKIKKIAGGIELDHSFLSYKKELLTYGYTVSKISLKSQYVVFNRID
nr:hypothetical protein [Liquorilactobacillus satsumensis]